MASEFGFIFQETCFGALRRELEHSENDILEVKFFCFCGHRIFGIELIRIFEFVFINI